MYMDKSKSSKTSIITEDSDHYISYQVYQAIDIFIRYSFICNTCMVSFKCESLTGTIAKKLSIIVVYL